MIWGGTRELRTRILTLGTAAAAGEQGPFELVQLGAEGLVLPPRRAQTPVVRSEQHLESPLLSGRERS